MLKIFFDQYAEFELASDSAEGVRTKFRIKPLSAESLAEHIDDVAAIDFGALVGGVGETEASEVSIDKAADFFRKLPPRAIGGLRRLLEKGIVGWENLADSSGAQIEFSAPNLKLFAERAPMAVVLETAIKIITLTHSGSLGAGERSAEPGEEQDSPNSKDCCSSSSASSTDQPGTAKPAEA